MTKQALQAFLFSRGIDPVDALDSDYALPSLEWLVEEFLPALEEDQRSRGLNRYVNSANNCNKFSRHAADLAAQCHLLAPESINTSLALGVFDYIKPDNTGHEVNIAVIRDNNRELQDIYFDAQTLQLLTPLRKENSVCSARF